MALSSQPDPVLIIQGDSGTFIFQYFELPETIKFGGPYRAVVHKQIGGVRQIDSLGPDPGPISWDGLMLTHDGWDRAQQLYAMYEAGDKVTVTWTGWSRDCIISDLKIQYRAANYVWYFIELTEVTVTGIGAADGGLLGTIGNLLNGAGGI